MVLPNRRFLSLSSLVHILSLICTLAFFTTGNPVQAQGIEEFTSSLSFRGFGTLGLAHSTEDQAEFLAHDLQGTGAGAGRSWSPDVDSRVGIQLDASITPQLSAVLQVVSEQRHDATYRPRVEWANLKYKVTPDFNFRAGRIVLPILMVSDSRKVGYAQPWVRPPVEVYGLMPVTSNDGIDMSHRLSFGEVNSTLQIGINLREPTVDVPGGSRVTVKDGWMISDTLEYGDALLHMAYARSKLTIDAFRPLFDGYRQFAAGAAQTAAMLPLGQPLRVAATAASKQAIAIAEKYDTDNKRFNILSIGGSYDPGDWFVMAEWAQAEQKSVYGKREGWYATGGYRFGAFTPFVSYAEAKLKSNQSDPGITALTTADTVQLNAKLNEQLASAAIQKTISLGIRWDFLRNAALKLQYDHSHLGSGSPGTLDHLQPGFKPGGEFKLFSATVDFVF